jgi:hypothetical protein
VARLPIFVALGACLLATGCCCPAISGRYYEVGLLPPSSPGKQTAANGGNCAPGGHRLFAGHGAGLHPWHCWRGKWQSGPVDSQQHADYVSPLPQFHPLPTQPVFEPQLLYPMPLALDPVAKPHPPAGKP